MKKILLSFFVAAWGMTFATSCIQEIDPQDSTITADQAANAPGSYDNFVSAITSTLVGQFTYSGTSMYPWDFGYPSFFLQRDVMGQDMPLSYSGSWYSTWYTCGVGLGSGYAVCQLPWTYYYKWIKNCNTVLSLAGAEPDADKATGVGTAYAMRAMFYMDLARMYARKTYALAKDSVTVPIVTEATALGDLAHNPRATNEDMWAFILSDLDKAEQYIAGYTRSDVYTPDLSVVYGLKARAYLTMEDWPNAQKYAKMAQSGYTIMTQDQYTSRQTGFNTPNSSWMFGVTFSATDPNILLNDGDSSWGSQMCLEVNPDVSGCGYASNYGDPKIIDRHLYETIPASDFRKNCFVDFALDNLSEKDCIAALGAYSDYPDWVYRTGHDANYKAVGGLSLKFRLAGGQAGHDNQHIGFIVAVPLMRVEEMYLIEAEAAGMQNVANGIALLTKFAQTRDAAYVYGTHGADAYGNTTTSAFQNEVWWQRRVELWGEGFATFDIKRLNKGIIRSYANTNHIELYRWNTTAPPDWMNLCIIQTEINFNYDCTNNPTPIPPTSDSNEYQW